MNQEEFLLKEQIINEVVRHNYLAASPNKFAQALGDSAGNTYYKRLKKRRAQPNKVKVEWEQMQTVFAISEADLLIVPTLLAIKAKIAEELLPLLAHGAGWQEAWVSSMLKKELPVLLPESDGHALLRFQTHEMRGELVLWMAIAWHYLEAKAVKPYLLGGQQRFAAAVMQLNAHLLRQFPARIDLQQYGTTIPQMTEHRQLNWYWCVLLLGVLLMDYVQPGYIRQLSGEGIHFGFGRTTWWHEQDAPLQEGAHLWMLLEPQRLDVTKDATIYYFTCFTIQAGGALVVERVHSLYFLAMQQHVACWSFVRQQPREEHDYTWALSSDATTLRFQPKAATSIAELPAVLQCINLDAPLSDVSHSWSRLVEQWGSDKAWQQHCAYLLDYMGYRQCDDLEVDDVRMGRTHVEICVRAIGGQQERQSFAIARHPGLQLVSPQAEAIVVERVATGQRFVLFVDTELFIPWQGKADTTQPNE